MGEHLPIEARIAEASQRWPGIQLKRKAANEAAGPCPWCGGRDRFRIWSAGNYECRPAPGHCGRSGWLDEENPRQLTDEERLALRVAALEQKQREHERRLSALEQMAQCTDHLRYHEEMPDAAWSYWFEEGMTEETIRENTLGYCPACPTWRGSPSYTIPVWGHDGTLRNISHRLVNPSGGKYRPHVAGVGKSLWGAHLLNDGGERVIVCEGEKKALVLNQAGFLAVGVMGMHGRWRVEWFDWLRLYAPIVLAFDPNATESAERLGGHFVKRRFDVRIAEFPTKPDDMIVRHGAGADDIEAVLRLARPAEVA